MAYLTAISGSGYGKRIELTKKNTVMGRHPDCDVVLESGAVSRQHASIEEVANGYQLVDLKSRNGTFVNGHLVDKAQPLSDGDLIRICDLEYSFHHTASLGSSELVLDSARFGSGFQSNPGTNSGSSFGSALGFVGPAASGSVSGSAFGSNSFSSSGSLSGSVSASNMDVEMVDDGLEESGQRSVQNKLNIRSGGDGTQLFTSAETRLQAVLDITRSLGRSVRLDEVLPKVLETLFRIFLQADRAFIVLVEDDKLVPRWINTRHPEQQESFRISRTVMREVMDTKEAIISLDASSDERFEMAQSISGFRIRSMIVAPLLDTSGRAIGAIQMDSLDVTRQFEKGDLEILASIAIQAGIAIENAQMHEVLLEKNRVEQDLELARQVQRAFLPSQPHQAAGYQFFDFYRPADQVGGDYFDYIPLGQQRLVTIVADVVGHGVAAAMLMAKLSAEARYCLAAHDDLAQAVSLLNQRISSLNLNRFVTLLCMRLNLVDGHVELVNAGHMLPILKRHGHKQVVEMGEEEAGVPLSVVNDFQYECVSFQLQPGDEIVLYTDGISEAPNTQDAMYGIDRLRRHVESSNGDISQLGEAVVQDVTRFTRDTRQADDMCLVIIKRE
ncbi:MAG: SpoIIE family protein phosphatase [Pirellulaceae bacterium]|nr:SpoIIE family protein phosphatase [Pirellulaceae bacterium]